MTKLTISPQGTPDVVVEDDRAEALELAAPAVVVETDEGDDVTPKPTLPEAATKNADGTVTLKLSKPVVLTIEKNGKRREETYDTLTFNELTGLDRRLVSQSPQEQQEVLFVARSARISSARMNAIWDRLAMRDIKRIEKVLTFLSE